MTADAPGDMLAFLAAAWRRKWWVLATAAITATAVGSYYFIPPRYHSDSLIQVVPQRVPEAFVRPTMNAALADRLPVMTQQILSRTRLERIIQDYGLYLDARATGELMEDIVYKMRENIGVEPVKGDAFLVSYDSSDPKTAQRVTERLASLFVEENLRDREVLAEGTAQFLESQIADLRRQIVEKEAELESLQRRNGGRPPSRADLLPYEVMQEQYKSALIHLQEAKMTANLERRQIGEQFKVIDSARLPERSTGPTRLSQTVAGALGGLALGIVLVGAASRLPSRHPRPHGQATE